MMFVDKTSQEGAVPHNQSILKWKILRLDHCQTGSPFVSHQKKGI